MLIGKETPDSGDITVGDSVKIVSVGQERMDELDSTKTVFEEISAGFDEIELGTQSIASRAYLSWFGFKGQSQQAKVSHRRLRHRRLGVWASEEGIWMGSSSSYLIALSVQVGNLSGGERNRVQLAKLLKAGGNFVILDEPSNDLDVRHLF
jgi:energy-dependent translational throttle protein EttA